MLVYDKERTFSLLLKRESNEEVHSKLEKVICQAGVWGLKGYFHAQISPAREAASTEAVLKMEINIDNILVAC